VITSNLEEGVEVLNFDDYSGTLSRQPFVQYLTSKLWTDRRLGGNEIIKYDRPSLWLTASGNNCLIGGDMARMMSLVEFYTELEHPELRKTQIENLQGYVISNRDRLFSALITLVKN
jgi:hypothetical protein